MFRSGRQTSCWRRMQRNHEPRRGHPHSERGRRGTGEETECELEDEAVQGDGLLENSSRNLTESKSANATRMARVMLRTSWTSNGMCSAGMNFYLHELLVARARDSRLKLAWLPLLNLIYPMWAMALRLVAWLLCHPYAAPILRPNHGSSCPPHFWTLKTDSETLMALWAMRLQRCCPTVCHLSPKALGDPRPPPNDELERGPSLCLLMLRIC